MSKPRTPVQDAAGDGPARGPRPLARTRRALHHLGQACFGVSVVALVAVLLGVAVLASGVNAPGWIAADLAQRINRDLTGQTLSFAHIGLRLDQGMAPRVTLRDVSVRGDAGQRLLDLSSLDITLSRAGLLQGALRPATMRLEGGRLVLRRQTSGALSIALDGMTDLQGTVPEQIGALLARPRFSALREVVASNLHLRYEDARAGRAWTADGGQARLLRDKDAVSLRGNVTVLGARDYATEIEVNYEGEVGSKAAEFGFRFEDMPARDIAGQSPALVWLSALDAPISGALRAAVDATGRLGPVNATLQIGAGALQPNPDTTPIPFEAARSYFTYDPAAQEIRFSELSVDSSWGRARAEGTARLVGMEEGWPRELQAQIAFDEIVADPADLYPDPINLEGASVDLRLRLDPFELTMGSAHLADQGRMLRLSGDIRAQPDGWALSFEGGMDGIAPARLLALWPRATKPKTRAWIAKNVHEGALRDIQLAVRAGAGAAPDFFVGFEFDDLSAVYVRDLPPIAGASGHASISDNRFVLFLESGHVDATEGGRMDISGSTFAIPDIRVKRGPAQARLKASGPITAALSLLDAPPFRFLTKAGQPVTLADGHARLEGRLDFLVKKQLTPEEVAFEVEGALHDLRSETLVAGRVLSARRLSLQASNDRIEIGGEARVDGVPLNGTWAMPLGPDTGGASRVSGRIELSPRVAETFGIGLPPGTLSGTGRGVIEVDFAKDTPPRFALSSDLTGLGLRLPQLGWSLGAAQTGQLDVTGRLGEVPRVDALRLDAAGLQARGSVTLTPEGALQRAAFSRVEIGDWLSAPVSLIGRGAGVPPRVEVTGGRVDLRRTSLFGGGRGAARGGPVTLRLDRLQVSDTIAIAPFTADLDMADGVRGRFSGRLNGSAPIRGDIVPEDGRAAFRIRSDDAGRLLAAAGLIKQSRNGRMDLTLTPASRPGSYDGALAIKDLRVKGAPALAALLNTISVVGLLEQFDGQGLHFGSIDARFRLTPTRLTLLESSAVGASVGISMDGYYDLARRRMDMQGVISPVYVLNAIGRVFTRPGEGLIGFNYTLTGPASDPQVSVNPLSALAPGFLREMFRRPAPQVEGEGPPDDTTRPETQNDGSHIPDLQGIGG
jgi:hypothetical protein